MNKIKKHRNLIWSCLKLISYTSCIMISKNILKSFSRISLESEKQEPLSILIIGHQIKSQLHKMNNFHQKLLETCLNLYHNKTLDNNKCSQKDKSLILSIWGRATCHLYQWFQETLSILN